MIVCFTLRPFSDKWVERKPTTYLWMYRILRHNTLRRNCDEIKSKYTVRWNVPIKSDDGNVCVSSRGYWGCAALSLNATRGVMSSNTSTLKLRYLALATSTSRQLVETSPLPVRIHKIRVLQCQHSQKAYHRALSLLVSIWFVLATSN